VPIIIIFKDSCLRKVRASFQSLIKVRKNERYSLHTYFELRQKLSQYNKRIIQTQHNNLSSSLNVPATIQLRQIVTIWLMVLALFWGKYPANRITHWHPLLCLLAVTSYSSSKKKAKHYKGSKLYKASGAGDHLLLKPGRYNSNIQPVGRGLNTQSYAVKKYEGSL